MNIRKGVILFVINKDKKYLVLHQKKSNTYSLISGGIENGENEVEAVVREAKEEAGIKLDKQQLIDTGEFIEFTGSRKGPAKQNAFIYFADDPKIIVDNNEIDNFVWSDEKEFLIKLNNKPPIIKLYKKIKLRRLL